MFILIHSRVCSFQMFEPSSCLVVLTRQPGHLSRSHTAAPVLSSHPDYPLHFTLVFLGSVLIAISKVSFPHHHVTVFEHTWVRTQLTRNPVARTIHH